jgi:SDR family mycofactocin-dependent oxidoreductase
MGALEGRVAFITGAARGQGRSHALHFAREGADLVLIDVGHDIDPCRYPLGTEAQLEETARRCRELGARVVTRLADVREQPQIDAAVAAGLEEFGQIDILINNAGICSPLGPAHEVSEAGWQLILDIDLGGVWRCSKAVLPHMMERRSGVILSTSSAGGLKGGAGGTSYVAAKHGVVGLTKTTAIDYAPYGIRVNCVCPGTVRDDPELDSYMVRGVAEEYGLPLDSHEAVFAQNHLLPELMEASDISQTYVWLASDAGVRVTGAVVAVDAGLITK